MAPHMTVLAAKAIWLAGLIGWFIIRYPHQRRSRRIAKVRQSDRRREFLLMSISFSGLFLVPLFYVLTDEPRFANYTFWPLQAWLGAVAATLYLALFFV